MGRARQYQDDAAKQRAYRARKAAAEAVPKTTAEADAKVAEAEARAAAAEARAARAEAEARAAKAAAARKRHPGRKQPVPRLLVKVLGMLGSDQVGERASAALKATEIMRTEGLTWWDVLDLQD